MTKGVLKHPSEKTVSHQGVRMTKGTAPLLWEKAVLLLEVSVEVWEKVHTVELTPGLF